MIEIGFHTDAFNSSYWNFEQCLQWAQKNDVHWIECGMIDGVSWISRSWIPTPRRHLGRPHDVA